MFKWADFGSKTTFSFKKCQFVFSNIGNQSPRGIYNQTCWCYFRPVDRLLTVNYQFVHRQRYRRCSPGRRCGEDFLQGTGRPPPGLHTNPHQHPHLGKWNQMWRSVNFSPADLQICLFPSHPLTKSSNRRQRPGREQEKLICEDTHQSRFHCRKLMRTLPDLFNSCSKFLVQNLPFQK